MLKQSLQSSLKCFTLTYNQQIKDKPIEQVKDYNIRYSFPTIYLLESPISELLSRSQKASNKIFKFASHKGNNYVPAAINCSMQMSQVCCYVACILFVHEHFYPRNNSVQFYEGHSPCPLINLEFISQSELSYISLVDFVDLNAGQKTKPIVG